MQVTVECGLEVGDTAKDKSDSIRYLVLCQSWILGSYTPPPCSWLACVRPSVYPSYLNNGKSSWKVQIWLP